MSLKFRYVENMELAPIACRNKPLTPERAALRRKVKDLIKFHEAEKGNGIRIEGLVAKDVTSIVQSCKQETKTYPDTTVRTLPDGSVNFRIEPVQGDCIDENDGAIM